VALGDPLAAATLGLDACSEHGGFRLRPFPTRWPAGRELGFEVRIRPTVRSAKGEQDAFLQAVSLAKGAPLQRETVYAQWLRDHLAPRVGTRVEPWQGAVELLDIRLAAFQRSGIVRRVQAPAGERRRARAIDGPDAVLKGQLRVVDPVAFGHLLTRGVGRHRAFGFGMLMLGPTD
jgi:CRISPR system Cascade subunit CasE